MLEPLESRIAPATFLSATAGTFTDEDGDLVTVRFTRPILTQGNVTTILQTAASGVGEVLTKINLSPFPAAAGTGITVSVVVSGDGDGLTNVGAIDATGLDLGPVSIKGDLGSISAGDATTSNGGLRSLTVTSFGVADTIAGTPPDKSTIRGSMGLLTVRTDVLGAALEVRANDPVNARLAGIFVGGSVQSAPQADSGSIVASGSIGNVTVRGSIYGTDANTGSIGSDFGKVGAIVVGGGVLGGSGLGSGSFFGTEIASVRIGGVLQGGSGENSGLITAGKLGPVTIVGNLLGGGGKNSGLVASASSIASVFVGGSVLGAAGENSGQIFGANLGNVTIGLSVVGSTGNSSGSLLSLGNIGAVKIGGSLVGGGVENSPVETGQIWASGGSIASVTIGGSAVAGEPGYNGTIIAEGTLGPVRIGQDIFSAGGGFFLIVSKGKLTGGNAIASLTVGGSVSTALVLAGFNSSIEAVNPTASIGAVKVGGYWSASSIAAGVRNLGADGALGGTGLNADNFRFGDNNDEFYGTAISRIASISIGGYVRGSSVAGDHFGFVAGQIGSLVIDGTPIPLTPTASTDNRPLGLTGDFRVHEV